MTAPPGVVANAEWSALPASAEAVRDLVAMVRYHGLVIPVLQRLAAEPSVTAAAVAQALVPAGRVRLRRTLALTGELVAIARDFGVAGVPYACLKGPALAQELCGSALCRDVFDLDLLIPTDRLADADAVLRARGYRPCEDWGDAFVRGELPYQLRREYHMGYEHPDRQTRIELHWRLGRAEALLPLVADRVWPHLRQIDIGGRPVAVLPWDVNLVFLAGHAARHGGERLKWIDDFRHALVRLPPDAIEAARSFARSVGVGVPMDAILSVAAVLNGQSPPVGEGSARVDRFADFLLTNVTRRPEEDGSASWRRHIRTWRYAVVNAMALEPRRPWILCGRILTAAPNERALLPLPTRFVWLYGILRPILWLAVVLRGRKADHRGV